MKRAIIVLLVGGLIVFATSLKRAPTPEDREARREAIAAKEAETQKIMDFCVEHGKPFSTTVSYDQDAGTQLLNGMKACMKEHGVAGYENAPMPVKK